MIWHGALSLLDDLVVIFNDVNGVHALDIFLDHFLLLLSWLRVPIFPSYPEKSSIFYVHNHGDFFV